MPRSEASRERHREYMRAYYLANPDKFNTPEQRARRSQWAKDNKERVNASSRAKRAERLRIVHEAKSQPCVDCGIQYPPEVMDLDHVRGEKTDHVSVLAAKSSVNRLREEIAKCDVRCANCHRLRHLAEKLDAYQLDPPLSVESSITETSYADC